MVCRCAKPSIIGNVSILSGDRNVVGDQNVVASDEGQAAGPRAQLVRHGGVIARGRSVQAATGVALLPIVVAWPRQAAPWPRVSGLANAFVGHHGGRSCWA